MTYSKHQIMSEEISEAERETIKLFRERVADVLLDEEKKNDDFFLRKWLVARRFDLDKAEAMIRKHIHFMQVNGLDKVDENYVPCEAARYFHTKMLGYDSEGSVVRILHLGACDMKGITSSLSKMDSFRYATYVLKQDTCRQKIERANAKICYKQVYIFDLQGLNWKAIIDRAVAERAFVLLKNYEENHPESLKVVYVVNVPSFFSFIYNWLKTVLPESIISKIQILSQDQCQTELAKHIDPSILPASVGGLMTDGTGDPNCPSLYEKPLNLPLPESLMLSNQFEVLDKDPAAQKTIVDCGAFFKVEAAVREPNSALQWDFQTNNYDICLGLRHKPNEQSEYKQIIPLHRVESHRIPESGSFICQDPGIYELTFDNSYSWFTRKELVYKVKVVPPEKEVEN